MGDLFKVTAPSGLKLRSAPSSDGAVIIFAMLQGTIVEAIGASSPVEPHFVAVHVELNQPVIMQDGEQPSVPANTGYLSEEGFASADWLAPLDQPMPNDPGPITPVSSPPAVASSAAASTGGVMLLLVAVVAAALYAAK